MWTTSRAQSETLGFVLIFALVLAGAGLTVAIGGAGIMDTQNSNEYQRAENSMTLFDSRAALVALGDANAQRVSLGHDGGTFSVREETGWMRITHYNYSGANDTEVIFNETLGSVVYGSDRGTIAYQGGGVWKSEKGSDFTQMVSTPEFHYRGSTLTLPAYNITGSKGFSGGGNRIALASVGDPNLEFPDQDLDNPLEEGNVTVTVKSEYYRGWEEYFRSRTTGAVKEVDEEEQKVVFSLVVPTELKLTAGVMYLPGGSAQLFGGGSYSGSDKIEVDLPSADSIVDPEINKCIPTPQPNCVDLTDSTKVPAGSALDENKIYYVDNSGGSDYKLQKNLHAPNSNVTIVADVGGPGNSFE